MMRSAYDDRINDGDKPPYSRLFIVCNRKLVKDDLYPLFEKYGDIDDVYMPKDRSTGLSKGIAYVKYNKTSSAAAAIQDLHLKCIEKDDKPIKVMVSSNKSEGPHVNEDKFKRLFIKVQRNAIESEITEHFSRFGQVASVHLQKDKSGMGSCSGFAYVNFNSFLDAAKAFEQCDSKYRAIFATPKEELKRVRNYEEYDNSYQNNYNNGCNSRRDDGHEFRNLPLHEFGRRNSISGLIETKSRNFDSINVSCTPAVPQKCIEQLFNIIPGLVNFSYSTESNVSRILVKYETEVAAAHAVETLDKYEFPSGELLNVKPISSLIGKAASNLSEIVNTFKNAKDDNPDMLHLAEAIAQASSLIKAVTSKEFENSTDFEYVSGVRLPLIKPLLDKNTKAAKRCFLVLKPMPPPNHVLENIFCRFGDLIDISIFHNKTFGFAKYASTKAADEAIKTLHGSTLYGVIFKVMEADEKPSREKEDKINVDEGMKDDEGSTAHEIGTKRAKIDTTF